MHHTRVLILITIVFVGLVSAPVSASVETRHTDSSQTAQAESDSIHITQTLHKTPNEPGKIDVTVTANIDLSVTEFYIFLPESGTPVSMDEFERSSTRSRQNRTTYEWDGSSRRASVTYELEVNNTGSGEIGSQTVDTGDWALIDTPYVGWWWQTSTSDPVDPTVETNIAGSGALADDFAFLGEYTTRTHQAHNQEFRLIIPDAANLTESPEAIFDNLAYTSDKLRVGDRDPKVTIIVAPTVGNWTGPTSGSASDSAFWAIDTSPVGTAGDIWIHEYVHTRQNYTTTDDFRWFDEGSAVYYSALYPLQRDQIDWVRFRNYLTRAPREEQTAILTESGSGGALSQYSKGGVVAARGDYELRRATGDEVSLQNIIEQLNAEPEEVSNTDYIEYIDSYTDEETTSSIRAATTTPKTEVVWTGEDHIRVFGTTPNGFDSKPSSASGTQESDTGSESDSESIDTDQGGNAYSDGKANSRLGATIQQAIVTVGLGGIVIGLLLFRKRID